MAIIIRFTAAKVKTIFQFVKFILHYFLMYIHRRVLWKIHFVSSLSVWNYDTRMKNLIILK